VTLASWQQLCDRGPDLVLCMDFTSDQDGFATLAASTLVDFCFLHIGQAPPGRPDARTRQWAREVLETGRPVRAVLGYRAASALATCVADAITATGPDPPAVVLFDAMPVAGGRLDMRTATPLFLSSRDHELPVANVRNIALDVGRDELLHDAEVIKLVADLLRAEQSWLTTLSGSR
jgi:hypothetical protein